MGRKITVEIVKDFDGTFYANMQIDGEPIQGLPENVNYKTLKAAIKEKTAVDVLPLKALTFIKCGRKQYANYNNYEGVEKMSYSNTELLKLWANDKARRDFVKLYKEWGIYAETPEMNLTFHRYNLPDGAKIIVMEHMQKNFSARGEESEWNLRTKLYLQKGEYFTPDPVSEYTISDHLKELKKTLIAKKVECNTK